MIPGIAAKKGLDGAQIASNALKNDLYVRRWTTVKGKGKRAVPVEHELHINPVGAALGAAGIAIAAGVAGLAGALALRYSGKQIKSGEVTKRFMVDEFDAEYGMVTVVDRPAYSQLETTYIHGVPKEVAVNYPAITHQEMAVTAPGTAVLLSKRAVPLGLFEGGDTTADAIRQALKRSYGAVEGSVALTRSARVISTHPKVRKRVWCTRYYYEFKAKGVAIEDKASADKWWNPFD